jgi:hypothetical protein
MDEVPFTLLRTCAHTVAYYEHSTDHVFADPNRGENRHKAGASELRRVGDNAGWETTPGGIPCRAGYRAGRDTISCVGSCICVPLRVA